VAPDGIVDLRSDTVTRPTDEMRRALATAEVGDDGYGEDPTVAALEAAFAERVGKEAAMFVPSGTMGNQIAMRLLGTPGTSVIAGRRQHVVVYEMGGTGVNSGSQLHLVDDDLGVLNEMDVRWAIEAGRDHHWLPPSAVFVENTHMPSGGTPWPIGDLQQLHEIGLPIHLDGARLFNAEVATGIPAATYAEHAVTVMCCLSKGLGAPVGSLLAGPADLLQAARAERKRLGGAMRQAGILAAAGLVSLTMVDRLAEDHRRARSLAEAVAERWPDDRIDPLGVLTNVVVFRHDDPRALLRHLRGEGVLGGTIEPHVVRLVTHLDVDDAGLDRARRALLAAP